MTLLDKIKKHVRDFPKDDRALQDWFNCIRPADPTQRPDGGQVAELREYLQENLRKRVCVEGSYETLRKTYLLTAPFSFEDYLIALEWNRPAREKFYLPRQKQLRPVVMQLQRMLDGELDELFFSMPARVGKTTLLLFLATYLIGKDSEASNLYSAFSDTITAAFYRGVIEIIKDPITYCWTDVFPNCRVADTNAQMETLNIDRPKRYASLTCRSLYGTLNGACDCNGFLIADDLIGGIEEALNKDRLIAANQKVQNNLLPRTKSGARIIWMGTRWSMIDPIGVRLELLQNSDEFRDRRYAVINIPALDENDESNFDYKYGVGFDTTHYRRMRATFERNNDMASWLAQCQGQPIERAGALFEPQDMRFFNGVLPDGVTVKDFLDSRPDRVFAAVDPAWGGGDAVACPIAAQYGDDIFIVDVVYSFADKTVTQPMLAEIFRRYEVQSAQFECNKMTLDYKEGVERLLGDYHMNLTTKAAPTNKAKEARIFDRASDIRNFYFLEDGKRSKEYSLFMQNVFAFKMTGKNDHDDAIDSLAMLCDVALGRNRCTVEVGKRLW